MKLIFERDDQHRGYKVLNPQVMVGESAQAGGFKSQGVEPRFRVCFVASFGLEAGTRTVGAYHGRDEIEQESRRGNPGRRGYAYFPSGEGVINQGTETLEKDHGSCMMNVVGPRRVEDVPDIHNPIHSRFDRKTKTIPFPDKGH